MSIDRSEADVSIAIEITTILLVMRRPKITYFQSRATMVTQSPRQSRHLIDLPPIIPYPPRILPSNVQRAITRRPSLLHLKLTLYAPSAVHHLPSNGFQEKEKERKKKKKRFKQTISPAPRAMLGSVHQPNNHLIGLINFSSWLAPSWFLAYIAYR
jgi:hypothetical protein